MNISHFVRVGSVMLLSATLCSQCIAQRDESALSPALRFRIETVLFSKTGLPSGTVTSFGSRKAGAMPGFDSLTVTYKTTEGDSGTIPLLISRDNRILAQFNKYDLESDPRGDFSPNEGPARGGGPEAPVLIVVYDDLECPFCARVHSEMFPALLKQYPDKVRVIYRSFPLPSHPWAMRAAIDVGCLSAQSVPAYWEAVDSIHSGLDQLRGADAPQRVDDAVIMAGRQHQLDMPALQACIKAQDVSAVNASLEQGQERGVGSTPTLFINGLKIEGSVPLQYISKIIDEALLAANKPAATANSGTESGPAR